MEHSAIFTELEAEQNLTIAELARFGARLSAAGKDAREVDNAELADELEWEGFILYLYTPYTRSGDRSGDRFQPFSHFAGQEPFPYVSALRRNQGALTYYAKRANETTNPILKARYADFLWESDVPRSQKYQFAAQAIPAYLESVELHHQHGAYLEMVDALQRAVELAMQSNNAGGAESARTVAFSLLEKLTAEARARWILDIGEILLDLRKSKFSRLVTDDDLKRIRADLQSSAHYWRQEEGFHLEQDCLRLGVVIARVVDGEEASVTWQRQVAEALEYEAQSKGAKQGPGGGGFVAAHFYERALHEYRRLLTMNPGDEIRQEVLARVETIKVLIRRYLKETEEETQKVSMEYQLPVDELRELIQPLLSEKPLRTYGLIGVAPWLLPDLEYLQQQAQDMVRQAIYWSLAPSISIRQGTKVRTYGIEQKHEEAVNLLMADFVNAQILTLDYIFQWLISAGHWTKETMLEYFRSWALMSERDLEFVEIGIESYFSGTVNDYVNAVHVLTPRIESILKGLFDILGVAVIAEHRDKSTSEQDYRSKFHEQGLGTFLERQDVRSVLGASRSKYLHYVLVDPSGLNFRNDVAHGWLSKARCNRYFVQLLIFILLMLTVLPMQQVPQQNEGQEDEPSSNNDNTP